MQNSSSTCRSHRLINFSGSYAGLHEAASKVGSSSEDRVYVDMEGGTATTVQSAFVHLMKCKRKEAELLRAEAMEALASAGEVADVKAASTFDAENSDSAAKIGNLTMTTCLAFER